MKCVVDYIDGPYAKHVENMLVDLVDDLRSRGVDILRVSTATMAIDTPHVHITFVTDLQKLRGRKFDEIFGNVPVDEYGRCFKYPEKPRFGGSLFEYVLDQEGEEFYEG